MRAARVQRACSVRTAPVPRVHSACVACVQRVYSACGRPMGILWISYGHPMDILWTSYGHPVDMDPLLQIAEQNDLAVIEDAAEALVCTARKAFVIAISILEASKSTTDPFLLIILS